MPVKLTRPTRFTGPMHKSRDAISWPNPPITASPMRSIGMLVAQWRGEVLDCGSSVGIGR